MNYYWRPEELQQLRLDAQVAVEGVADTVRDILKDGRYFLLENPHNGAFWSQPAMVKLMSEHNLLYDFGHMCAYGLRGRNGLLTKKPTGWLSNHPGLLKSVTRKCNGQHEHEECMGGNAAAAAIYTKQLARSVVHSLVDVLHDLGDERFVLATTSHYPLESLPYSVFPTTSTGDSGYVDLQQDHDAWRPLLKEGAERLEGKVAVSAEVKPSAYLEQIKTLAPWHLTYVQIYRTPKTRRLPTRRMLENPDITHRGAALLFQDGSISIESQSLEDVTQPNTKFDRTVRVAIFLYGRPMQVETSAQRKAASKHHQEFPEPEQTMADWEPGAKDITFPGLSDDQLPRWMQSVLKRVHTNLGHPHNSTFVRQLAQANASPVALMGARALKRAVCERLRPPKQPRPSKSFPMTKRFNERLMLDLVFVKDMAGETFGFLNQVDDTTTYQVLSLLPSRESSQIIEVMAKGWFLVFQRLSCWTLKGHSKVLTSILWRPRVAFKFVLFHQMHTTSLERRRDMVI